MPMIKSCYVSHSCSQCGGDVLFTEKTTGTECRYCSAGLMVVGGRSAWLNFLIKPLQSGKETAKAVTATAMEKGWKPPLLRSVLQFYFPYYRSTGQVVRWMRGEKRSEGSSLTGIVDRVRTRHADTMRPAFEALWSGLISPGIRAQTLKLFVATRENAGNLSFVPIKTRKEEFTEDIKSSLTAGLSAPDIRVTEEQTFFVSERNAVLYFPLSLAEIREGTRTRLLLFDAVGGGFLREITRSDMEALLDNVGFSGDRSPGEGRLKLAPLICPECAGDLDLQQYAVVRFCHGCGRGWELSGGRLRERDCLWTGEVSVEFRKNVIFLPFWRRSAGKNTFHIPAFGIRSPNLLYNASVRYLKADFPAEAIPYNRKLVIKNIPALVHADEMPEIMAMAAHAREVEIPSQKGTRQSLLMVPFRRRGTDLVDLIHGMAVPISTLDERI